MYSLKGVGKKLDDTVRRWCRLVRTGGVCERCGYKAVADNDRNIQWCHIKSRGTHSIRWSPDNCLCLCGTCHQFFGANPDEFGDWLNDHRQFQLERLREQYKRAKPMKEIDKKELLERLPKILKEYEVEEEVAYDVYKQTWTQ